MVAADLGVGERERDAAGEHFSLCDVVTATACRGREGGREGGRELFIYTPSMGTTSQGEVLDKVKCLSDCLFTVQ